MAASQVSLPAGFVLDTSTNTAPAPVTPPAGFVLDEGVNMLGQDGKTVRVPPSQVAEMRKGNYAVHPDNPGAQKMVTPDGKITYALPNEVQQFEASGHTKIAPDGRFEVKPIQNSNSFDITRPSTWMGNGEDSTATMARAAVVARALGQEQMAKSMQAEKNWWTSKEGLEDEAAGLVNVGTAGADTLATLTGASAGVQGAKAGLRALGETEMVQLMKSSPRLYAEMQLKNGLKLAKTVGKNAIQEAIQHPIRSAGIGGLGSGSVWAAWHWLNKTAE